MSWHEFSSLLSIAGGDSCVGVGNRVQHEGPGITSAFEQECNEEEARGWSLSVRYFNQSLPLPFA